MSYISDTALTGTPNSRLAQMLASLDPTDRPICFFMPQTTIDELTDEPPLPVTAHMNPDRDGILLFYYPRNYSSDSG